MRAVALFLFATSAFSQGFTISGTVSDFSGQGIAKAAIQVFGEGGKVIGRTETSATGAYTLARLPAGAYDLTVIVPGMPTYLKRGVVVGATQTLLLDIKMEDNINLNTVGDGRATIAARFARHQTPAGPTPRTAEGRPDLSGMWWPQNTISSDNPSPLPWAQALQEQRAQNQYKDYPLSQCLPSGAVVFGSGALMFYRVVQSPSQMVMIDQDDVPGYRLIFLDGRGHPKDPEPSWMGHSVGKWEGDTLVVDTVGFNDKTWLTIGMSPHTEKLHLTERFRRPDLGHLEIEMTIDDPGAYAKPWTIKRTSDLAPEEDGREYVCVENNRDVPHMVGK